MPTAGRAPKVDALREVTVRPAAEPIQDARPQASQSPSTLGKIQFTVYIERELVEELRDAANILAGDPHYLTISQIVTNGARAELRTLQDKHNSGKPFPHTGRRGQPGRRPSR